jgi:hypothetical protein
VACGRAFALGQIGTFPLSNLPRVVKREAVPKSHSTMLGLGLSSATMDVLRPLRSMEPLVVLCVALVESPARSLFHGPRSARAGRTRANEEVERISCVYEGGSGGTPRKLPVASISMGGRSLQNARRLWSSNHRTDGKGARARVVRPTQAASCTRRTSPTSLDRYSRCTDSTPALGQTRLHTIALGQSNPRSAKLSALRPATTK